MHGDRAAKAPQPEADPAVAFFQQAQAGFPAHHAPRPLAGFHVIRREQIGDAVGDGGNREDSRRRARAHQRNQPPVEEAGKYQNGDHQPQPSALGEGKKDGQAHHASHAERRQLPPCFFAVIGKPCRQRRQQHQQRPADIGAARDGEHTGAHGLFGVRGPGSRNRDGDNKLIDAVQRDTHAQHQQRPIKDPEIAVILNQPDDDKEP